MTALVCKGGGYLSDARMRFASGEGGTVGDRIVCLKPSLTKIAAATRSMSLHFGEGEDGSSDGAVVDTT